jgi:hypothetical protein
MIYNSLRRIWPFAFVTFLAIYAANAQPVTDPLKSFNGRWVWIGDRDELGVAKACAIKSEEFESSPDGTKLLGRVSGNAIEYTVLYQEANRITMYLKDEKRRLPKTRDRLVWVAIFENPGRYRWRIHSRESNPKKERRYARIRCPTL